MLKWCKCFLVGRKQRVVIGDETSEFADVVSGVPQGSVLGPLFFVIFAGISTTLLQIVCG